MMIMMWFPAEPMFEMLSTSSGKMREYNTLDISNVALQSIRYGIGLRPTAAITTAAFIDAGLITEEDKRLVVDHSKVKKEHRKNFVMKKL